MSRLKFAMLGHVVSRPRLWGGALALGVALAGSGAMAAMCSDTGAQYEAWKSVVAQEARAAGVGERGIAALMGSSYSKSTIAADRNQKKIGRAHV